LTVRVAAHLIVGAREEPFLPALLASIDRAVTTLIVNDNSPEPSPHAAALAGSTFARENRLIVDRTAFTDFAHARNVCLRLHAERDAGEWAMFVDADEVHDEVLERIAARLGSVSDVYDFVDGYSRQFFASFDWFESIGRQRLFFRFHPGLSWEGAVHERLCGHSGKRLALPYVFQHYSHALTPRRFAEKGRLYSSLGAPGEIVPEEDLASIDAARYFADVYPRLLRYRGVHPPAARVTIERLRAELAGHHALTERQVRAQSPLARLGNAIARLNYEQRWRLRALRPLARALVAR
jgi:hypothetical protein